MIFRKINNILYDALVVHLNKITLANFLVVSYEGFAVSAGYFQDVAAPDFSAVWIFDWVWSCFHAHPPLTTPSIFSTITSDKGRLFQYTTVQKQNQDVSQNNKKRLCQK